MFVKLILLFTIVPMLELAILIKMGDMIGIVYTIFLVAFTGIVGVSLAKIQGLLTLNNVRTKLSRGQIPSDNLLEGLLILIGGALLLTPGLLTDITGFALILPGSRKFGVRYLKKKLKYFAQKNVKSYYFNFGRNYNRDQSEEKTQKDQKNNGQQDNDYIEVDFEEQDTTGDKDDRNED